MIRKLGDDAEQGVAGTRSFRLQAAIASDLEGQENLEKTIASDSGDRAKHITRAEMQENIRGFGVCLVQRNGGCGGKTTSMS